MGHNRSRSNHNNRGRSCIPHRTTSACTAEKISFYAWWAGLEAFAIDYLIRNFTEVKGIKVEKTAVPGGAGVNAKFAIIALIMADKPPEAFQVHCGPEMISYFLAAPNREGDFAELTDIGKEVDILETPVGQVCLLKVSSRIINRVCSCREV